MKKNNALYYLQKKSVKNCVKLNYLNLLNLIYDFIWNSRIFLTE